MQPGILYKIHCFIYCITQNYSVLTNFMLTYSIDYVSINMLGSVCGPAFCRLRAGISPPSAVYDPGYDPVHSRLRAGAVRPSQNVALRLPGKRRVGFHGRRILRQGHGEPNRHLLKIHGDLSFPLPYAAASSIFSIKIPYPVVGSFTSTWVTAPTSLPSWMIGLPLTLVSSIGQNFLLYFLMIYMFFYIKNCYFPLVDSLGNEWKAPLYKQMPAVKPRANRSLWHENERAITAC